MKRFGIFLFFAVLFISLGTSAAQWEQMESDRYIKADETGKNRWKGDPPKGYITAREKIQKIGKIWIVACAGKQAAQRWKKDGEEGYNIFFPTREAAVAWLSSRNPSLEALLEALEKQPWQESSTGEQKWLDF